MKRIFTYCIIDEGDHSYPEATVNLFKTEEKYRKYIIGVLKDNECLPDGYDDLPTDDLVAELNDQTGQGNIDGSYILEPNILERY